MVQPERESDGHADEPVAQDGAARRPPAKLLALEIVVLLALAATVIVMYLRRRADSPPIPTRQRTVALDEDETFPVYVRDWGFNDEGAWQRLPIVGTGTSLAFDIPPGQEVKTVVQYGNPTPSRYSWYQKLLMKIGFKVRPMKIEPLSVLDRFGPGEIHEVEMWADSKDPKITRRDLVRLRSKTGLLRIRFVGFDINLPSDFARLRRLKNLGALRFEDCRLNDSIFPVISRLRSLRQLSLSNTATTNPLRLPDRKAYPPWRPGLPITDAHLAHLKPLVALEELDVSATSAGNEGLAWIGPLAQLRYLNMAGCRVDREGLARISRLPQLRYLEVAGCNVDEEGLALIGQMRSLEFLSLSSYENPRGFREGLAHLAKLPVLRTLHLSAWLADEKTMEQVGRISSLWVLDLNGSRLDAESLAALCNLPQLRGLVLGEGIGDRGLLRVSNLSTLTALSLFDTRVSDAGLAYLTKLPALERLVLQGVGEAVTDAGLDHLAVIVTLREIRLKKTGATPAGVARLRQALPKCSVTFDP